MIGVDIVYIPRIKNATIDALKREILSIEEQELCTKAPKIEEFLAGRFAAKEAFLKANHCGLGEIPLKEIKVLYNKRGAPIIRYHRKTYDVSISHDGDYVVAVVNV